MSYLSRRGRGSSSFSWESGPIEKLEVRSRKMAEENSEVLALSMKNERMHRYHTVIFISVYTGEHSFTASHYMHRKIQSDICIRNDLSDQDNCISELKATELYSCLHKRKLSGHFIGGPGMSSHESL